MARKKLISDTEVLDAALALFAKDGDRAISFGAVGLATGLAPATLVQRFVTRDALYAAALGQGWARATAIFQRCDSAMLANGHNAVGFLKALGEELTDLPMVALLVASGADTGLRALASGWRQAVEHSLTERIEKGQGQTAEAAAALFAAWSGRILWQKTEGADFRLRVVLKKKPG